jgi:hypothetical protein
MPNPVLFVCGLIVTLVSGMGVLIYITSLGYKEKKKYPVEPDIDLGAHDIDAKKLKSSLDSFIEIPSVS